MCLLTNKTIQGFTLFFLSLAWSRRPCFEPAVQLAWIGQARWQHLHRDQPRVWNGRLYHHLPHEHREEHHRAGQHWPVSDGVGGRQTRALPWDSVPQTAQQQQQAFKAAISVMCVWGSRLLLWFRVYSHICKLQWFEFVMSGWFVIIMK